MKTFLRIALFTLLVVGGASRSYALLMITEVASEKAAKDWGATIRTEMIGTNRVGVRLEFAPKGKLQTFDSAALEIMSGDRTIVSATLAPSKRTPDSVMVYFSTDPAYLSGSSLTLYYKVSGGLPPYEGVCFKVVDCLPPVVSPGPVIK